MKSSRESSAVGIPVLQGREDVKDGLRKVFLRGRVSIDEIEKSASFETKFPVFTVASL